MKKVIQYIAEDGKTFLTSNECKAYEYECRKRAGVYKNSKAFDIDLKEIPILPDTTWASNAYYLYISNPNDFELISNMMVEVGYAPLTNSITPPKGSCFLASPFGDDNWENLEEEIEYRAKILKALKKKVNESKLNLNSNDTKDF